MWKTYKSIYKIESAISCNHIIYNLQHIPVIGKLFKDSLYSVGQTKLTISIIFSVLGFLTSILKQLLYFAVFFIAPICIINGITPADLLRMREMHGAEFLWIFIFLNIILGGKLRHSLKSNYSKVTDTCLKYMRLDSRKYFVSRAFVEYIKKIALILPVYIVIGLMFGIEVSRLAVFFFGMMAVRIFFDGVYALPIDREIRPKKYFNLGIYAIFVLFSFAAAYIPIKLATSDFMPELMGASISSTLYIGLPIATVVFVCVAVIGVLLIKKYSDYEYLRREELEEGEESKQLIENATSSQAVLKEKDINLKVDSRISNKKGYDYLNALFMARYKKMFAKRSVITALVSVVIILGVGVFDLFLQTKLTEGMLSKVGLWFFAIYIIAFRDRYTLALFNNIDKYMLPYAWYRRPESIIKSYFIRLRSSFKMNATITLPMMVAVLISSLFLEVKWGTYLPVIMVILLLTLFYSMHYLTLYYLIQPYSEETKVKSYVYNFFNAVVYMASYTFLRLESVGMWVLAAVAAIIAVYLAVSLVLLRHRAPKSFRLR